jgi:hypothetical protein
VTPPGTVNICAAPVKLNVLLPVLARCDAAEPGVIAGCNPPQPGNIAAIAVSAV